VRHSVLFLVGSTLILSLLAGCSGSSSPSSTTSPVAPPVTPANNPAPTITSISPTGVPAGSPSQTLTVTGTGYISSTAGTLNGAALQTTYVSATSLQAVVPASALAAGQVANLVLSNPSPGGGSSDPSSFSIMSPTPAVTGLSPRSVPQGVPATITVNGSGFEANSVVMCNGAARPITFVNGTTLQARRHPRRSPFFRFSGTTAANQVLTYGGKVVGSVMTIGRGARWKRTENPGVTRI
jgi:hypothetical protein